MKRSIRSLIYVSILLIGRQQLGSAQTIKLAKVVSKRVMRTTELPGEFYPFLSTELHAKVTGYVEKVLKELSLWEKKDNKIMTLSGGMKRRVLIAKALAHEPQILFLDEPTAGVDVERRKDMWQLVRSLRASGVTIILTTHYLDEAEEMADRIGFINHGELSLVEDKATLMRKLGRKELALHLTRKLDAIPASLAAYGLTLSADGCTLVYGYDTQGERTGITGLLDALGAAGISFNDLNTTQSSLEDIFVDLVKR